MAAASTSSGSPTVDMSSALRRQQKEPMQWTKPKFAEETGGCTVELQTNAAGEAMVLEPIIHVPGPETYVYNSVAAASPWAGRSFRVKVMLDAAYPFKGPGTGDIVFQDIPFHPNVMPDGSLCCDGLNWKAAMSLKSIAKFIVDAIGQPNGDHFVNPDAGKMINDNKAAFEARARTGDVRPT